MRTLRAPRPIWAVVAPALSSWTGDVPAGNARTRSTSCVAMRARKSGLIPMQVEPHRRARSAVRHLRVRACFARRGADGRALDALVGEECPLSDPANESRRDGADPGSSGALRGRKASAATLLDAGRGQRTAPENREPHPDCGSLGPLTERGTPNRRPLPYHGNQDAQRAHTGGPSRHGYGQQIVGQCRAGRASDSARSEGDPSLPARHRGGPDEPATTQHVTLMRYGALWDLTEKRDAERGEHRGAVRQEHGPAEERRQDVAGAGPAGVEAPTDGAVRLHRACVEMHVLALVR